jgi:hypothetical protein
LKFSGRGVVRLHGNSPAFFTASAQIALSLSS